MPITKYIYIRKHLYMHIHTYVTINTTEFRSQIEKKKKEKVFFVPKF